MPSFVRCSPVSRIFPDMNRISITIIAIVFLALVLVGGLFVQSAWLSAEQAGAPISIVIAKDHSAEDVRASLVSSRLIRSEWMYRLYGVFDSAATQPKPGTYVFRPGASFQKIAQTLFRGQERTEVTATFIEGKTIRENAEALQQSKGVDPAAYYALVGMSRNEKTFDRSLVKDFAFLDAIPSGHSLEGYLFPDTYRVWEDELPEGLIRKQLETFAERIIKPNGDAQQASGMTWHQIITLASVVEGEVRTPEDRKLVADIFLRRIKNGMRLQSDATLNYVMSDRNDRPDAEDLAIVSPYNTYDHDGLPPGPVNNPAQSAIEAVLYPTPSDYFYFLTDKKGKVYYAKTYEEHLANKYRILGP